MVVYRSWLATMVWLCCAVWAVEAQSTRGMSIIGTASISSTYSKPTGYVLGTDATNTRALVATGNTLFAVPFDNPGNMGNPIFQTIESDDQIIGAFYDATNGSIFVCTRVYRRIYWLGSLNGQGNPTTAGFSIRNRGSTNTRYWNACAFDSSNQGIWIASEAEIGFVKEVYKSVGGNDWYVSSDYNGLAIAVRDVALLNGKVFFGGNSGNLFVTSTSNTALVTTSTTRYTIGIGQIQSIGTSRKLGRVYIASDLGVLTEIDANSIAILRNHFEDDATLFSVRVDDNFNALFMNAISRSTPITSRIVRVNLNDENFETFGVLTFPSGVTVNRGELDPRNNKYQIMFINSAGDTVSMIRTASCTDYTCSTCSTDKNYCGYCSTSRACVTPSSCAKSDFFTSQYICPTLTSISPSSGSTDGGTVVTVTGQFTDAAGNTLTSGFECQWGAGARITAEVINGATLRCVSPSNSAGDTTFRVYYSGSLWAPNSLTFSYYSCSSLTSATPCVSCFVQDECGICIPTMQCASARGCPSGFAKPCPVISNVSPATASILGSTQNFTITIDKNINANYQCVYASQALPALVSTTTAATLIRNNTLSCAPPIVETASWNTARGANRELNVDLVVKVSTSSAVLTSKMNAVYLFDCYTFAQDCSSCTSSLTQNACAYCFDSQQCRYSSFSCSTTGTCTSISSISPSRVYIGNVQAGQVMSITGRFASLPGFVCAWNAIGDNISPTTTNGTHVSTTAVSCQIPLSLIAGRQSVSIWAYSTTLGMYTRVTSNFLFDIYSCVGSCSECLDGTRPECVFCSSSAQCMHVSSTCSNVKWTSSDSCPRILNISPSSSPNSGNVPAVITGVFDPTLLSGPVSCRWWFDGPVSSPATYTAMNEVHCNIPALAMASTGYVELAVSGNTWTNSLPFLWYDCAKITGDCSTCLTNVTPNCTWCTTRCDSNCADPELTSDVCPSLTSATPNVADIFGGETITITGGPFFSRFNFTYECRFGDKVSPATIDGSWTLKCATPVALIPQTVNLTVWMNGINYAPYSSVPFTFFSCLTSAEIACNSACVAKQGCGWCLTSSTCTSASRCSDIDDVFLTQCFNVTMGPNHTSRTRNTTITVTFSPALPSAITAAGLGTKRSLQAASDLTCVVEGSGAAEVEIRSDTEVACFLMADPIATSNSSISLLYQENLLLKPREFYFASCESFTDCTQCLNSPFCGWCSNGICTIEAACDTASSWGSCPDSPTTPLGDDATNLVSTIVPAVVVPVVVIAAGLIVLLVLLKRRKKQNKSTEPKEELQSISKSKPPKSKSKPRKSTQSVSVQNALDSIDEKMRIPFASLVMKKEIGAGSYGKVYLGEWRGAKVAIKVCASVANIDGFFEEASLTVGLPPHPNVVQTFGISIDGPLPCIVLEYCSNGSLDQKLFDDQTRYTLDEKVKLIKGIALGLLHLHKNSIVHRDLAARNILLTKNGEPKISDFGMSRLLKEASQKGQTKTNFGPIRWMAPESLRDLTYSTKSDVWSFGIVMLTEAEPHTDVDGFEVAVKIKNENYHPAVPESVNLALRNVMLACWNPTPSSRPSMENILDNIGKYFTEENSD